MTITVKTALLCAVLLLLQQASAELHGRCPAQENPCPSRATPCSTDDECGEQVCCQTSCGQTCVDPLYTGCENIKLSSERISRALAAENSRSGRGVKSLRSPRCRVSDGEFEEIQCDNEIVSSCWCVDPAGFEVPGTRAPAASLVNCTRTDPCAAHTCRMLCPLGFELDDKGCPLCKCRDPCSSVTCPGQLSCQLEETPCLRPPCPPVPTCKRGRSLQNVCPVGEPLLISETSRPFLCGTDPGKPNCPPLYRCLVESGNDYGVCCPASLELQKAGTCPVPTETDCGTPCAHDLECPSMQKCCDGGECGRHCILPHNVTMCTQQKMLAELLVISEREGRGYVPQCTRNGEFVAKQCSRNGLVCWCVDTDGNKLRGSMGPAANVECQETPRPVRTGGRSMASCARALCAGVCEYGYKSGTDGCPSCECDDPCEGFPCDEDEECVRVREADCTGELCTGYPVLCEYLRDFDEKMEGTVDGMKLALPAPTCKSDGSFTARQCGAGRC
ncbi:unnamed protein product [Leptidea sinapis]|uniref:Thyroglobulin type-1 domain-containing protein n=1 Tax=Leptidea sinapis TaxID=189913 RepID=A0A5E4PSK3_9NEOP|nr:unnamed protein product [Leptidea sinapis]